MPNDKHLTIITSVYPPEVGGPGVYFVSLKHELEKRGWMVEVLSRSSFFTLFSRAWRSKVVLAHATPKILLPLYAARLFKKFRVAIRIGGDFFWERAVEQGRFFGTLRDFYARRRFTVKEHVLLWFTGLALRGADAVVFTSPLLRDIYIPLFGLNNKRAYTVTHPVPEVRSKKHEAQTSEDAHKPKAISYKLLYAGRFLKLKNLHMLLEVFGEMRKKHPNIRLTLIGEGPELINLRQTTSTLQRNGVVVFKKPMSHDIILEEITRADLVVLPSLSEASPNLLMDAYALGVPMLATRENGLKDILGDAVTWFSPMSKEDFSAKLEGLLAQSALQEMREKIKTNPYRKTWEDAAKEYERICLF